MDIKLIEKTSNAVIVPLMSKRDTGGLKEEIQSYPKIQYKSSILNL